MIRCSSCSTRLMGGFFSKIAPSRGCCGNVDAMPQGAFVNPVAKRQPRPLNQVAIPTRLDGEAGGGVEGRLKRRYG